MAVMEEAIMAAAMEEAMVAEDTEEAMVVGMEEDMEDTAVVVVVVLDPNPR